jgi:hypothetical protein
MFGGANLTSGNDTGNSALDIASDLCHVAERTVLVARSRPLIIPKLYFLGFFNSDTALNWISEGQVRWIREVELGRAVLPSSDEMLVEIEQRRRKVEQDFKGTVRHGIEGSRAFALLRRPQAVAAPSATARRGTPARGRHRSQGTGAGARRC